MNTTPSSVQGPREAAKVTPGTGSTTTTRALVLAGGGAAGNAWQLGLIAGLSDAGLDVTTADLVIETSAGPRSPRRSPAGHGRPNCMPPYSPRCPRRRP